MQEIFFLEHFLHSPKFSTHISLCCSAFLELSCCQTRYSSEYFYLIYFQYSAGLERIQTNKTPACKSSSKTIKQNYNALWSNRFNRSNVKCRGWDHRSNGALFIYWSTNWIFMMIVDQYGSFIWQMYSWHKTINCLKSEIFRRTLPSLHERQCSSIWCNFWEYLSSPQY